MNEIKALDILGINPVEISRYSIRLNNVMWHFDPWTAQGDAFYDHLFGSRWSKEQNHRYIKGEKVLQFLQLEAGSQLFVFIGGYEVGDLLTREDDASYFEYYDWKGKFLPEFAPFARRLVVRFKRESGFKFQRMDFNLANETYAQSFLQGMTVEYIRSSPYELRPFPGYANVRLSHPELVRAVNDEQWRVALNNVQAIYLQTDLSNGWHYVGSAYSQQGEHYGLLSRWEDYAYGDHTGGNALLKQIPNAQQHIEQFFQYSILDVFDMKTDKKEIIEREHWWMDTLGSIRRKSDPEPHGYNSL